MRHPSIIAGRGTVLAAPLIVSWLVVSLVACGSEPPEASPAADISTSPDKSETPETPTTDARQPRTELLESLRADLAAPRHPRDGGGRAWIEDFEPGVAGSPGRWTIHYEAGPRGVAEGGMVFLQVSPFWGWSTPQTLRPEAPGYTEVTTDADGVELAPRTLDQQLLGVEIGGRELAAGERLRFDYGAGAAGAVADRFAEAASRFGIAVDGDGDGVRKILAESPGVEVRAGEAARLLLTLPSTARPGDTVRLTVALVDRVGNAGMPFSGEVLLAAEGFEELPPSLRLGPEDAGRMTIMAKVAQALGTPDAGGGGVVRVTGEVPGSLLAGESNPMQVSASAGRILWGDLQVHSGVSDGTGRPEDLLVYARDVAALDVVAITDHDHWGLLFLDEHPELWRRQRELVERFDAPGRFVPILGFEWTNWIHGHRHVLDFAAPAESTLGVLSSIDPELDHPEELWAALRGQKALTVAHHSAGGPIATDWTISPDPELEPVTEIVSVHGSSEAADSPSLIYRPVAGNFVRDALGRGYRFGFLGSSDGHDGHPGLGHLASPTGGLAAILAEDTTREAVYEALKARRTYATSGPRIILRTSFAGYRMGEDVPLVRGDGAGEDGGLHARGGPVPGIPDDTLVARLVTEAPIERVDLVRSGTVESFLCDEGARECTFALTLTELAVGEYIYLRVVQEDGGLAWSSPFFLVDGPVGTPSDTTS